MTETNYALDQARLQVDSINEMVDAMDTDDVDKLDRATQAIAEDPLSVEVRSGWYTPGSQKPEPEEFTILLCTGGPAVRIRGDLDEHLTPTDPIVEYQDWGTPWTEYHGDNLDRDKLLTYCYQFFYGE